MIESFVDFFTRGTPGPEEWLLFPPFLLASAAALQLCAWWKRHGARTGDTRKAFHFFTYGSAAVILARSGLAPLAVFGTASSLVILHAIARGPGHPHYEALARESDAPHRTRGIAIPYLATLLGGSLSSALFGPWAVVGFLVTGLGDAAGEVVGSRIGHHRYRVPAYGGAPSQRSIEGSIAVFAGSTLSVLLGLALHPELPAITFTGILIAVGISLAIAAVEAVAPHGWDNLVLMLLGSGLAAGLLAAT